jgi:hypothetical protein
MANIDPASAGWPGRGWRIAVITALLTPLAACSDRADDERTIVAGEHAWGQAFVKGDAAAIDRLLADDFRGIAPDGSAYDKASMLADVRRGPPITSDSVGPITVRFFGDTAVAQGSEQEIGPAPERHLASRIWTDVWIRRDSRWQIVAAEDLDPARR